MLLYECLMTHFTTSHRQFARLLPVHFLSPTASCVRGTSATSTFLPSQQPERQQKRTLSVAHRSGQYRKAFDIDDKHIELLCTLRLRLLLCYNPLPVLSSDCTALHYAITELWYGGSSCGQRNFNHFFQSSTIPRTLTMQCSTRGQKYIGQKLFDWKLVSTSLQNSAIHATLVENTFRLHFCASCVLYIPMPHRSRHHPSNEKNCDKTTNTNDTRF